jgi:hypothetical protein
MDRDYYRCCTAEELVEHGLNHAGVESPEANLIVALAERLDHKTAVLDDYYSIEERQWRNRDELLECLTALKNEVFSLEDMIENLQSQKG